MPKVICGCGKSVETKAEWAGQWISCPGCGGTLYAPFPGDKPAPAVPVVEILPSTPAAPVTRLCPWCAETISAAVAVCPICKGDAQARPGPRPAAAFPGGPPSDTGGMAPLILGILGFVFCPLFAPAAWVIGSGYERDCRGRGFEPSGAGRVGKILGIIGTVFLILGMGFLALGTFVSAVSS